jgi:hypothetical protein
MQENGWTSGIPNPIWRKELLTYITYHRQKHEKEALGASEEEPQIQMKSQNDGGRKKWTSKNKKQIQKQTKTPTTTRYCIYITFTLYRSGTNIA